MYNRKSIYQLNKTSCRGRESAFAYGTTAPRTNSSRLASYQNDSAVGFGSNTNEGIVVVPFPKIPTATGPKQTSQSLADDLNLTEFQCPTLVSTFERITAGRERSSTNAHLYQYPGNFSDVSPSFWEGAYHQSELPHIFGTPGAFRAQASEFQVQTSVAMQDLWLAFAKDSDRAEAAGWMEAGSGMLLMLGEVGGEAVTAGKAKGIESVYCKFGLS